MKKKKINIVLIIIPIIMIIIGGFVIVKETILKENNNKTTTKVENNNDDKVDEIKQEESEKEENKQEVPKNEENPKENKPTTPITTKAPLNSEEYKNLEDGEYLTEKDYTLKIENGLAYIDGILIVNKTYSLPSSFKPTNIANAITGERCNNCLDKETLKAFNLMKSDATSVGLNIYIASGYRSYTYQESLYNRYTMVSGTDGADTYSARAGHSEHQTGLCFDLNSVDDSFANTNEGIWINNNAYLYGFVIRYPKGKDNITGYKYEPWHLRYVGKDLAKVLYNNGNWITIEEHFGINSNY